MSEYDISDTLAPNSEQLDAIDLISGERTFTITKSNVNLAAEQPVNLWLAEFDRPWRPGKSMRRVLAACWGPDSQQYIGRRVTLYCDTSVTFGKVAVGGTRIRALSHIDGPRQIPLLVAKGRTAIYTVEPLADASAVTEADQIIAHYEQQFGVTRQQLEAHVALPEDDWTPETLAMLKALGKAIKAGEKTVADVFGGS